jgi:putative addiction module killer protein
MLQIITTSTFDSWLNEEIDRTARLSIAARMTRLQAGDTGDARSVGDAILELPIDHGSGYRLYLMPNEPESGIGYVVLSGSDGLMSRAVDIATARSLAAQFKD